jgi:hypothetical protein
MVWSTTASSSAEKGALDVGWAVDLPDLPDRRFFRDGRPVP